MKFGTLCVRAGEGRNPYGAHSTPIYQTSTFLFENAEQAGASFSGGTGYKYIRSAPNTPTHAAFIKKLCALEGGKAGLAFSSGMAAESTLVFSQLKKGDHLLSTDVIYGGTYGLFSALLPKFEIDVSFVDTTNIENVKAGIRNNTRMIYLESPANPTMAVCDIREICEIAREIEAICVVDNTFATPYFQQPIQLGADAVVESCTKYIGGHGDLLGGAVIASEELIENMKKTALITGGTMGTHEAWLCLRGLKTLHLRMERHYFNALRIARFLENHSKVHRVNYPGLVNHLQHDVARRQMSGYSGMLSFELKGGLDACRKFMNDLKFCSLAVSLGSVDTLVEHPASMTHAIMPKDVREKLGITDSLIRISVGIEDEEDIEADLEQALKGT